MRITHNKVGQNLNLRDTQKSDASQKSGSAIDGNKSGPADSKLGALDTLGATQVNISERAQDIKKAKEIAMKSPDVNEARIAELQKLIDEGKYKTDAKAIADKMVDEQLRWE